MHLAIAPEQAVARFGKGVDALLVASVSAALTLGLLASTSSQSGGWFALALLMSAVWAGVTLAAPRLARSVSEQTWNRAGLTLLVLLALGGLAWAVAFSSMQGSDFGVYYRCGTTDAPTLLARLEQCQSKYLLPTALYWTRSVLYTVPLGLIAGDRPEALDIFNALLNAASLTCLFFFVRRLAGAAAATVAILAWGLFPERLFGITLATSDNLAVLLCIALLVVLSGEGRSVLRVAALGALLFGLDLLRGAGQLFAAASLLAAVTRPANRGRRIVEALAAIAISVVAKMVLLRSLPLQFDDGGALRLMSGLDLSSTQNFLVGHRWGMHVWPAIPPEERTGFALSTLRTELSWHVGHYPRYAFEKAASLFAGNGNAFFSSVDLSDNADTVHTVARSTVPRVDDGLLRGLVAGLSSSALVGALMRGRVALHGIALAVVAPFFALVLLLWEPQPRYLLLVSPALAVLAAMPWAVELQSPEPRSRRALLLAFLGLFVGALTLAGVAWVTRPPAPLLQVAPSTKPDCGTAEVVPGVARTRVVLASGVRCAAVTMPVPSGVRSVQFLVTRASFPYLFEPRVDPRVSWTVADSSGVRVSETFGLDTVRYRRLDVKDAPTLMFVFSRESADEELALELADVVLR